MRSRRRSAERGETSCATRCEVASRFAELHAAARDRAGARVLAEPDSRDALRDLEDAEQLNYLAAYELRRARRALRRREALDAFIARFAPAPPPARARRR